MTRRQPAGLGGAYSTTLAFLRLFRLSAPPVLAGPRGARGTLREIVFRSYRIFYDVSEESLSVEILHVWHGARDEPAF